MTELAEQLERNFKAVVSLDKRYQDTVVSVYWNTFKSNDEKVNELLWISKIKARVLVNRHRILENIQIQATKELQSLSSLQRKINLEKAA